jgi:hypothetical protein
LAEGGTFGQRLGRWPGENGCVRIGARTAAAATCSGGGAAIVIARLPVRSWTKSSISAFPPAVERDEIGLLIDEGQIGDAAEIKHSDGIRAIERAHHGAMEYRYDRRALPTGRDVGSAKIVHHRDAEPGRKRYAVPELDGEPAVGPVQDGLAMEADHRDRARRIPLAARNFNRVGIMSVPALGPAKIFDRSVRSVRSTARRSRAAPRRSCSL